MSELAAQLHKDSIIIDSTCPLLARIQTGVISSADTLGDLYDLCAG